MTSNWHCSSVVSLVSSRFAGALPLSVKQEQAAGSMGGSSSDSSDQLLSPLLILKQKDCSRSDSSMAGFWRPFFGGDHRHPSSSLKKKNNV